LVLNLNGLGFSNLLGWERGPEIYKVSDENMDWTSYTVFSYKFQHWINPQCGPNRMHLRVHLQQWIASCKCSEGLNAV